MTRMSCYGNVYMVPEADREMAVAALVAGNRLAVARFIVSSRQRRRHVKNREMLAWVERFEERRKLRGGSR